MPLSACRKSVLLEKSAVLHAEETAGTRAEFRFPASGCRTTVLPPSERWKAQMPQEHLFHAAFNCFQTYLFVYN